MLSSELFALSADDLLELSTGMDEERGIPRRRAFDQGFRHIERKVASGCAVSPALAACASLMRRASEQVGNVALADIMQGIVGRFRGGLARLEAAGPEGLARAGNVYKAIRMARDIEAAGGMGPAGVAEELALRVELAKEAPGALSAEGGDFVRIMTVHASKGLEFPIVAVAELRDDAARSQALECCSIEGRTYVSLDGGHVLERLKEKASSLVAKSGSYQPFCEFDDEELAAMVSRSQLPADRRAAIKLHEERGEAAESRRLLYVALTRAKEALVVSMARQVVEGRRHRLVEELMGRRAIGAGGRVLRVRAGREHVRLRRAAAGARGMHAPDCRRMSRSCWGRLVLRMARHRRLMADRVLMGLRLAVRPMALRLMAGLASVDRALTRLRLAVVLPAASRVRSPFLWWAVRARAGQAL